MKTEYCILANYILEKERNQYRKLLNEIRDIVKNKG